MAPGDKSYLCHLVDVSHLLSKSQCPRQQDKIGGAEEVVQWLTALTPLPEDS